MQVFREYLDAQNRASIRRRLFQITQAEYDRMSAADKSIYDAELFRTWELNYEREEGVAPRSHMEQSVEDHDDWTKPDHKSEGV